MDKAIDVAIVADSSIYLLGPFMSDKYAMDVIKV